MDVLTYRQYVDSGLPFGDDQAMKLERLLSEPSYEAWYSVIGELLKHRKRVEQESIRGCWSRRIEGEEQERDFVKTLSGKAEHAHFCF